MISPIRIPIARRSVHPWSSEESRDVMPYVEFIPIAVHFRQHPEAVGSAWMCQACQLVLWDWEPGDLIGSLSEHVDLHHRS